MTTSNPLPIRFEGHFPHAKPRMRRKGPFTTGHGHIFISYLPTLQDGRRMRSAKLPYIVQHLSPATLTQPAIVFELSRHLDLASAKAAAEKHAARLGALLTRA